MLCLHRICIHNDAGKGVGMNLIDALMKTGLTRHESELYVALCREGEVTGYELAKITGIPRANVYQALSALTDKGGARIMEGNPQRYVAVLPEEYCRIKEREMQDVLQLVQAETPKQMSAPEGYVTLSGSSNILGKMRYIIEHAKERVYLSIMASDLPLVRQEVEGAIARGLRMVIITSEHIDAPGAEIYTIHKNKGQVRLIADSTEVLTGEITGSDQDVCLYSKNRPLVVLIKDALKNEIELSKRGSDPLLVNQVYQ
jgi:HTH-type transcriptional regulator, sugar sensing transcriptional regulator